ncbi:MAG: PIG-L deacetylase family protein [Candidatus Binatia bacterium]
MFNTRPVSVLAVVAHADDLELMAGGTVARLTRSGHAVHVLTISNGEWTAPDGRGMRERDEALAEERKAAACLGYTVENLGFQAMELKFEDSLVCEVLRRVEAVKADVMLCPWERDIHHDHEVVSRIAMAASRRIASVIMGQINYYLRDVFTPNVFVDITSTWERKIEAMRCFETQWERAGKDWYGFLDETSRYYGRMVGVERAEGFVSRKVLV